MPSVKQMVFGVQERYYCIHCNWTGFDYVKSGEFEVCPKCEWACYSESEVERGFLFESSVYPKLAQKYWRIHKRRRPDAEE